MRRAVAPLTIGLTGLMLVNGFAGADQVNWDCRMAPDGRSWQCYKDGVLIHETVNESLVVLIFDREHADVRE